MTLFACMYASDYKPTLGETDRFHFLDRPSKEKALLNGFE
jgi:hypothetical protein